MVDGWHQYRLVDLGRVVTGRTPPGTQPEFFDGPIPFLTPTDMDGRRSVGTTARSLSDKGAKLLANIIVEHGVAVSCIGWQMGKALLIDRPTITNQQINSVIPDRSFVDDLFLYYSFSMRREEIFRLGAGGTRTPILNKSGFEAVLVDLPPLGIQRSIASVLSALDDKIELNRRLNETLEVMARAIFRDWFVDFGPTRAKMEGRAPYLASDIWSLFPDRFDADGKPEGWKNSSIGAEVDVVGGSTPSTKDTSFWIDGTHCWATPKDLSTLNHPVLLDTERKITDAGVAVISSGLLPSGTVLLSSRAPIGYLAIAEVPTAINQGFIAMRCPKEISNLFALLWCRENMEAITANANGSTFQEISKTNFRPIPLIRPAKVVLLEFEGACRPLYDQLVANVREMHTLASLRDLLLPKLMSGEIRVRDAEKNLEEAA